MLKVIGLKKSFPTVTILRDINFSAEASCLTVIEGRNGVGKSTLFNILCGIVSEDDGNIILNARYLNEIGPSKRARHLAFLRQDPSASSVMTFTVLENFALSLLKTERVRLRNACSTRVKNEVTEHLNRLGLYFVKDLDQPLSHFSGGQRQMLAFAMTTFSKPDLLLLDEPTAALDAKAAIKMMDLIKRFLCAWNIPSVMISHDHDLNRKYADAIYILEDGLLSRFTS